LQHTIYGYVNIHHWSSEMFSQLWEKCTSKALSLMSEI